MYFRDRHCKLYFHDWNMLVIIFTKKRRNDCDVSRTFSVFCILLSFIIDMLEPKLLIYVYYLEKNTVIAVLTKHHGVKLLKFVMIDALFMSHSYESYLSFITVFISIPNKLF